MVEFKTKSLGDLTSIMTKGIVPKYIEEASNSTIVVLNQKCNRDFSVSLEQSRLNDCSKRVVPSARMLRKYDVLINSTGTGTAGRVAQLFDVPEPMTIDSHMILIRPTDEIDPLYYGYAVKLHQAEIEFLAEGSTGQTEINRKRLESEILISFPENIAIQKQIGRFLYQIDQKIWINTVINDNLMQQATIIFHEYFDEYDVINSTNIELGNIANFKYGTMPKKDKLGKGTHIVFSGYQIVGTYPECMFEDPQLIIVARGVGGCGDVKYAPPDCYLTNLSIAIITENTFYDDYIFHYLRLHDTKIMNTGSAQPQITVSTLEKFRIPLPPKEKLIAFSELITPFKDMFRCNTRETERLSLLRDALLPKLMSGELDVSSIDI